MSLGRYGKLAEEYLKVKDKSRYSLLLRTGKAAGDVETDRGRGVGSARPDRGELRENESGGSEDQSIGYDGNDQTAERGGNDSPGDRDSGGYLQTEITDINDSDKLKKELLLQFLLFFDTGRNIRRTSHRTAFGGTSEPMARQKIYHFFELNEGLRDRARYLCQMYEAGDTISTEAGMYLDMKRTRQESNYIGMRTDNI